jgi:hypothetical protein
VFFLFLLLLLLSDGRAGSRRAALWAGIDGGKKRNTANYGEVRIHSNSGSLGEDSRRMEDWRAAVDERTGRTYWYHRITRESTWTRPQCFETINVLDHPSLPSNDYEREKGYETLLHLLEGLGGPEVLVELLHDQSPELQHEAIQLFLSCCLPSTVFYLAKEPGAIDGLIQLIMLTSTTTSTRRNALRALCCLALNTEALDYFVSNQGWIALAVHFMKWPDMESTLLFIILICLLLSSQETRSLITQDILLLLKQFLAHNCPYASDKYGNLPSSIQLSVFDSHPSSQGVSLLDGTVLIHFAGLLNISGEGLPGTVLLTLAGHCLRLDSVSLCLSLSLSLSVSLSVFLSLTFSREEKYASIFIAKGGINALQLLCGSTMSSISPVSSSQLFSLRLSSRLLLPYQAMKEQGGELLVAALEISPLYRRRSLSLVCCHSVSHRD